MKQQYLQIVRARDEVTPNVLNRRIVDPDNYFHGGIADGDLLAEPGAGVGNAVHLACVYSCKDSRYYRDASLLPEINECCRYVLRMAHDNGTADLLITNFRTPATFELHSFVRGYRVFTKYCSDSPAEKETADLMLQGIAKLARGMLNGGFHTPNHRWVETGALLMTYNLLGWPELKAKADKYLAEGIDIDEYGEFTERSSGMYNGVNDNAMLVMAEEGPLPEMYDHARKNMELLFDYIEGDGSIFTQNSRRKDKGEGAASGRFYPGPPYYYLYLWAGWLFNDLKYVKFADEIFWDSVNKQRGTPGDLWLFLLHPELQDWEPDLTGVTLQTDYSAYYPKSNIFRRRKDNCSWSIIANNPNFLFLKCGDITVYVRMCASFFAIAQFLPEQLEKTETGYRLSFHATCDYRLPLDPPPASPVWDDMDHTKRGHICRCDLDIIADFTETENGLKMKIKADGCDRVPFKLEYIITPNCRMQTDNMVLDAHAGEYLVIKNGGVRLEKFNTGETLTIHGMFAEHLYHTHMRGSVPQAKDGFTLYSTAYTPVETEVEFTFSRREHIYTEADPV